MSSIRKLRPAGWLFCWLVILTHNPLFSQVQFKIELLPDQVTYQASMKPLLTWSPPLNITSTAQFTIKVPTGGFEVNNLVSLQPGTFWSQNARYNTPSEAPGFDYISFGLTSLGTSGLSYIAGVEVPLFTFVNNGICTGSAEVMLETDPFFPPNSENANVNNQIATLGTGLGNNGFAGAYDQGVANCLPDAGCLVAYELTQLSDGTYRVSLIPGVTWPSPANTTDTLYVALKSPAGSLFPGNLQSSISGVQFALGATFNAPAQQPGFDYHLIRLTTTGTTAIAFTDGVKTPLFTFTNTGFCSGDSIRLVDNDSDAFAAANQWAKNRLKTTGSGTVIFPCTVGNAQPVSPAIQSVMAISPTNCTTANGFISINAGSGSSLQYSIDNGTTWHNTAAFSGLPGATYHAAVQYQNGTCKVGYSQNPVELTMPSEPQIQNVVKINAGSCGASNGAIFISATGAGSLEYSIDGGNTWQPNGIFGGLSPGTFMPVVRNAGGSCPVSAAPVMVNSSGVSPVIQSVSQTLPGTCGGKDGSISISASGNGSLQFSINNGLTWSSNPIFNGLGEGNYNVLVRATNSGCVSVYPNNPVSLFKPGCPGCLVDYELEILPNGKYQVSLIPHVTWNFPQNITATSQVTIVAPTGGFYVSNLTNLLPGVEYKDNVRINAPIENPGFDYIAFGLQTLGTSGISYQNGVKVPLFTFENGGICTGPSIFLMDDNSDPFTPPNSTSSNMGQQLTTVGSGQDAFVCILQPGMVTCTPELPGGLEAITDVFDLFVNTTFGSNVTTNDLNPGAGVLSVGQAPVSQPLHGTVSVNTDGTFTYTPVPNYTGPDNFLYLVCDNGVPATCDTGLVVLYVHPALSAMDDEYTTFVNNSLTNNVLDNDLNLAGSNWAVNATLPLAPAHGTVNLQPDGDFVYSPASGFTGVDSFQYIVCQNTATPLCDTATVVVIVLPPAVAEDDYFSVPQDGHLTATVLGNDATPPGTDFEVALLPNSGPFHGSLVLNPDGTFVYSPDPGFTGNDQYSYALCEIQAPSNCDYATVYLTVAGELAALNDQFSGQPGEPISGNLLTNDVIPGNLPVSVNLLPGSGPGHGVLSVFPNGNFTYTPDPGYEGADEFQYVLCETGNPSNCDTASVTLLIEAQIEAIDDYYTGPEATNLGGNLLSNDQVAGASVITLLLPGSGQNGGMVSLQTNGQFSYSPNLGFTGNDYFDYQVCLLSQPAICDTARVYLTIFGDNDNLPTPVTTCPGEICSTEGLTISVLQTYSGGNVSFNWFNGNGQLVGNSQTLILPSGSPLIVPPFRVRAIVGNQLSALSAACDFETVSPPVALAHADAPVCSGSDLYLFADSQPNAHFEWRLVGSGALLSTQQNPVIYNVNQSGIYEVTVFNDACPGSATAFVNTTVLASPEIDSLTGGGTYCHGEAVTLAARNNAQITGNHQYTWTGPNGFYFTAPGDPQGLFPVTFNTLIPENEGSYTLVVTNGLACSSDPRSVIIDYVPIPETPHLSVEDHILCQGETLQLNSTLHTGETVSYYWRQEINGSQYSIGTTNFPTFFVNGTNAANAGVYHVVVEVDGCFSEPSNLELIEVVDFSTNLQASNPTTISAPGCEGTDIPLSMPIVPGASYQWFGPNGFYAVTPNPVVENAPVAAAGEYFVTINIPACNSQIVASTEVFVGSMPSEPFLINNSPLCEGSDLTLQVTNPDPGGTVNYLFYYEPTNTMIGSSTSGSLSLSGVSPNQQGKYFAMANKNGCIAAPSNMTDVSVDALVSNAANAGDDAIICNSLTTFELHAIPPSIGSGEWTSPTGAIITNPDQPTTLATGLETGQNIFVWSLSNGSCQNYSTDTITITVQPVPDEVAFAGADREECNITSLSLSAAQPQQSAGYWTQPNWQTTAGVTISNANTSTSIVSGLEPGQVYTFTWNLAYGACDAFSRDEVVVNVQEAPAVQAAIVEDEIHLCDEDRTTLEAYPVSVANGAWRSASGATVTSPFSFSTAVKDLPTGANVFYWSLSTPSCSNFSVDSVIVYNEDIQAVTDTFSVQAGDSLRGIDPSLNDQTSGVSSYQLTVISPPQKGEFTADSAGLFSYKPYPGAFGEDVFTYMICSEACETVCDVTESRFLIDANPVLSEDCFVPNTITPNGDGFNDTFIVPCVAYYPESACTIFNRWFDPVYQSEDYKNDWGGTYEGQPLPVGTYFYLIELNDDKKTILSGYVVVYRE
jgi:gliding motility-associated-like protein